MKASELRSELSRLKRRIYYLQDRIKQLTAAGLPQSAEMLEIDLESTYDEYFTRTLEYEATGARGWWASVGATVRQLRQTLNIFDHESPHSRSSKLPR